MRSVRLFQILDFMRGRTRPVSAEVIAERFGTSVRTIYRDIATLQSIGAPIRGEGGLGYQVEDGYFLPPLAFDRDEMDAVVLGLRMVTARGDTPLRLAAERVLGKISGAHQESPESLDRPLLAVKAKADTRSGDQITVLRSAIHDRTFVGFTYTSLSGDTSQRCIRPLGLTAFESSWLLTGWCEMRGDFRNFRVDLMSDVAAQEDSFAFERGKEFTDYLATL
ncbi:Predicted DNA-binding transcriptional regulator YafY, contains an HTH and WYL domains [Pseudovibrio denitrificans]|uniref:Predicted DNA-binding transcriptional regulator YafY, contains an HTH and WYL domains n=1 Tax=Pseudovibrio denitrificans TaxID=258256 RepID=A0A1I7C6C8_9HYPH|nr:YafY family protein [Pseudovibrio denitrificans]SFT94993.1 Predicted DNA-binding transcriptional regulator YafY, contains an HTH and WYL domains [Pseudovibrio denitrificans]